MGPTSATLPRDRAVPDHINSSPSTIAPSTPRSSDQMHAKERHDLITSHMAMAAHIARTFAGRGQDLDDLTQVAMLELVRAVSRFDPYRGVTFAQYAFPCIVGAIKKYFRDSGWSLHVGRRTQDLHVQTRAALPGLIQLLGRTPTIADLATHLNLSEKDARAGMDSYIAYRTRSLNLPTGDGEDGELGQLLGEVDDRMETVPDRHILAKHVAELPARERSILYLRFVDDLCQREIAERIGISQMHVSRLLSRCMSILRAELLAEN